MVIMRSALLLLVVFLAVANLMGQPITKSTYNNMIDIAEEKMEAKDYYNALDYYQRAYEEKDNPSLLPMIAELSLKIRDYGKAQRTYANILRRDKDNEYGHLRYDYGLALKGYERFEEAIEQFQLFMQETDDQQMKERAQVQITGAEMALAFKDMENDNLPEPERISRKINQPFSEYAPALDRSGSLYYSTIPSEEVVIVETEACEGCYAMIYRSALDDDGDFQDPAELGPEINRPGYHTSGVSFSRDGNTMFYTQAELQGNTPKNSRIYYSLGGDDQWKAGNELIGVNGEWLAMHPAPGELFGNRVLFFVSDMDGGEGGLDIYYATYKDEGVYGDPVNLGPKINTPGDEITPFYFDGTLYFSSDGHPSIGGQDIFYTVWNGSFWTEPQNMGAGFNSPQDDQYLRLDNTGYKGMMTSNRPGGRSVYARTCCDDIYGFEIEKIEVDLVVGVFDAAQKVIKGATVDLKIQDVRLTRTIDQQTNADGNRFDFPLELENTYQVIASKEGYISDTALIATVGLTESRTFEQRFYLEQVPEPKPAEPEEPEYDTVTIEQAIVLENILYDFNDDKILPAAESDLQVVLELMYQYPEMIIEMGSHTDNRGEAPYNEELSQRRAESARSWLIERDVEAERIVAKGYGEEAPKTVTERVAREHEFLAVGDILNKEFIDALEDEEQQEIAHQINRRTEFKIIEGPTSITIKRTRLLKKEDSDGDGTPDVSNEPVKDPRIHPLSSLYGSTTEEVKGLPVMVFEDRTFDFGNVKRGDTRTKTLSFTNQGDTPLSISVVSACECTTTEYPEGEVAPGESGEIKIIFDSTEKEENEIIDVDIILDQTAPDGSPIIEKLRYKYNLTQ